MAAAGADSNSNNDWRPKTDFGLSLNTKAPAKLLISLTLKGLEDLESKIPEENANDNKLRASLKEVIDELRDAKIGGSDSPGVLKDLSIYSKWAENPKYNARELRSAVLGIFIRLKETAEFAATLKGGRRRRRKACSIKRCRSRKNRHTSRR